MPSALRINPNAFVTEADTEAMVVLGATLPTADENAIVKGINWATSRMERMTGRRLKARNYKTPLTITADISTSGLAATGSSLAVLQAADVDDDVIQLSGTVALASGTRVSAAWDGSHLALTPAPTTTAAGASIVIGSEPLILDYQRVRELSMPEWPLVEVFSLGWLDDTNTLTPIDLTNAMYDYRNGRVRLSIGSFIPGSMNTVLEARLGYEQPAPGKRGDWAAWEDLTRITQRLCAFFWQQYRTQPAAYDEVIGPGGARANPIKEAIPRDVYEALMHYRRRGR